MNLKGWWRFRQLRKRRRLIQKLRLARDQLASARKSLEANRAYQPVCLGGLEDKVVWEEQSELLVAYWHRELSRTMRKLKLTPKERARYLGIRDVSVSRR